MSDLLTEHMHKVHRGQMEDAQQIELLPEDPPMVADGPSDEAGGMTPEELKAYKWPKTSKARS